MHRMRSYQQRHERAPRDRIASRTGHRYSSQNPQKKEESTNLTVSLNIKKENITNPSAPLIVMDESQRPYCFTFNKLTNLKRFEVFGITDNRCDWDTLDRVLATLLFGNHEGASSIGEGEDSEIRKARSQVNQIKEFSIQTQSQLGARFVKILSYFKNLEVLELQYLSCQDQHSFSICDLQLCRDLKVLRMGAYALWGDGSTIFKDLGRLTNLRELRTTCSSIQFQWIIDAKRKIAQHSKKLTISQGLTSQCTLIEANKIDAKSIHDERHPLFHCLPKLRVLGCAAPPRRVQATLSNVTEAFADQLEELVFCCFRNETSAPSRFEHPFCHLRRLAIRGFKGFDYLSLAQCCPMVELLVIHPSYCFTLDAETPNDIIVEAIVELKRLRCLYLEGIWRISSDQFLKLATDSISLYKIGIHNGKNISLDAYNKADRILNAKSSKYPLRSKGVYRLPESEHPYSLDALYFGYTDE
ncbi:hypothetical protein BGZ46_000477 [Entomortierella lignicola]|nr:hypothetical protein BGZ46_000477 [Entomortierella lignicola]